MKSYIKKFFIVLTILMLCFTVYLVTKTYAVFYSEGQADLSMKLARWDIKVNNLEVTTGTTKDFTITDFNILENANVKSGKIAPGTSGSFDILIDPTNTQVSIRYDLTIDSDKLQDYQIQISSITETTNSNTLTKTGKSTYTGIIPLNKINGSYNNNIRIVFKWDNNEDNNAKDTNIAAVANSKTNIPITLTFTQYLNETISEYEG